MSVVKRKAKDSTNDKVKTRKTEEGLAALLKSHPTLKVIQTEHGEKIKSTLTGHEFKSRLDLLEGFISSKAYSRAIKGWYDDEQFKKYEPYIVANKKDNKKLFCHLTKISLNKIPEQVEKHVNGKKYRRLRKERELKEAQQAKKLKAKEEARAKKEASGETDKRLENSFSINRLEKELSTAIESEEDEEEEEGEGEGEGEREREGDIMEDTSRE